MSVFFLIFYFKKKNKNVILKGTKYVESWKSYVTRSKRFRINI